MGQYKVPQNVEAEDKILGPLTFKQFIYALIGFGWATVCFGIFRKYIPLMLLFGIPPTMFMMLLAFYNRDGQTFEQYLAAIVRFFATNRKRVWFKGDAIETFHVTATPKAAEITQRNPDEVRSELEKLSNLIDSRGWNHPQGVEPTLTMPNNQQNASDRLVAPPPPAPTAPDEVPADILDMQQSPLAQNLAELLRSAAEDVREEAMQQMTGKAVQPAAAGAGAGTESISGVTPQSTSDILKLATQSDELTVSQVAAQANRVQLPNGQVVEIPANGS